MERYYDKSRNRILHYGHKASARFWDEHWNVDNFKSMVERSRNNAFILKNTRRFLKEGVILEGEKAGVIVILSP